MRTMRWAILAAVVGLGLTRGGRTDAAFSITFTQQGNDVIASGSGSLATADLAFAGQSSTPSIITPIAGTIYLGSRGAIGDLYQAFFSTTAGYGPGSTSQISSGIGGAFGFYAASNFLTVPLDYVSGSLFTSSSTFSGRTLASLGLGQGVTTYAYSATRGGTTVDRITVQVNLAGVPEPSSLVLMGLGLIGLGSASRKRRS